MALTFTDLVPVFDTVAYAVLAVAAALIGVQVVIFGIKKVMALAIAPDRHTEAEYQEYLRNKDN